MLGCGSGILIGNFINLLNKANNPPLLALTIDINFDACYLT